MTRREQEARRKAWALYREGKGPKPKPRPAYPSELKKRAQTGKAKKSPVRIEYVDPVDKEVERRNSLYYKNEHAKIVEMLRVERERNAFLGALRRDKSTPKIIRCEKSSGLREMTAVSMASDWHVEETVPAVKAGFRNEYNMSIAEQSINRFFQAQIDLVRHHRASKQVVIRDMVCAFTGDLMSGYIHQELRETNALSPTMTAIWLRRRIRNGLITLLDALDLRNLLIPWSYGNHGRTTPQTQISTGAENSYEHMLGLMLEDDFRDDPRVKFDTSPTAHQYAEVYDFTLHFHHGDSLKYAGGVGGLGIPLLKAVPAWDEIRYAHYHHIGHFHQLRDYGRAMVNGSMIGFGPYSHWIKASFEAPQQLFYLLDSKRGKCHVTPLWVREEREKA
jgi:hypothetical protein